MAAQDLPVFPFDTPPEFDTDPEHGRMRRENPVAKVRLTPGGEAYLVTRYEDVKRVFADPVFSRAEANKPGAAVLRPTRQNPYLIVSMDAPEHTRLRKLVARAFTARAVERMRPRIQDIADRLVDRMVESGPPVDFVAAFAEPLPTAVISQLIGAPSDDHERIRRWMDVMLSVTAHSPDEIEAAAQHVLAYLGELIATKRAQPAEDLLTALIAARDGGDQLSEPELLFTTYILLIAGFETTASLLTNSLLTLQRHPDQLALLRDNPDLIPDAVEELLRYIPITNASLERVATRDVVLGGVPIRAGSTVLPLMYSANRDEALTEEPDRFDVTRRPVPHLTFGHGIHHCLGAPLARMELVVAYRTLLRRLPGLRPADRHAVVWKTGLLTRAPVALPVVW